MATTKKRFRDMTEGPEWKRILLFALPIMLGQLLQQLYATVDSIVLGNFGPDGSLGAVSNCAIVANVFLFVSVGMANGSAVLVAQMFGARRREDMRESAATSIFLLGVMGIVAALTVILGARLAVVGILGIAEENIRTHAITYLRIYAVGLIFSFVYNIIAAILRSVGDSKAVLYFLLISTVMNTLLDLLFVAVFRWGVAGAAIATVLSQLVCVCVSIGYMSRNYEDFRFPLREIRPNGEKLRLCLKLGLPSALQQLVVSGGYLLLQRLINSFGEITINAWAVGHRYDQYICIPPLGMMQAMSSFAGQNIGAGKLDRVKRGLWSAVVMDMIMVVIIGGAVYLFARPLTMLFGVQNLFAENPEPLRSEKINQVIAQAVECLHFLPFAYLIFAFYLPFNGMFTGAGDPGASAIASLTSLVIRVITSYGLAAAQIWTYNAVWRTYVFGWGAATIFVTLHFLRGKWQEKSLVRKEKPA